MTQHAWLSLALFIAVYLCIVSEKIHRTKAALAGGLLAICIGLMDQVEALKFVDFNTLGLLIGMMILVALTKETGLFEYLAVKAVKKTGGHPVKLMLIFFFLTAVISAFLDNVTTVLLLTGIIFNTTKMLGLNPIPFLISEVFASNVGGTATLIGDPPNIMIGGSTGLGFNDFIVNLALPVFVIGIVTCGAFYWLYRKELLVKASCEMPIEELDEKKYLKNRTLLKQSLFVLALTMAGFVLHQSLHLDSATVAMAGAVLLLLITPSDPEAVFREVEWTTIFFFVGLFILVGALQVTGIIETIAKWTLAETSGNKVAMHFLILWVSAIASAFIDNIPFVATMIPLIKSVAEIGQMDVTSLWWTLSLGACLGGNGTIIGASANVVVSSIAASLGRPISFGYYFKVGFPVMLLSIIVAQVYIWLAYL